MLPSLFHRLLGRGPVRHAAPPPRPARAARAEAAATPLATAAPVGARRPLVSPQGGIAGFEFHLGESTVQRRLGRGSTAAGASTVSLLAAMRLCTQGGLAAFSELPVHWLMQAATADSLLPGMHLALLAAPADQAPATPALVERIGQWRAAGARIGWREGQAPDGLVDTTPDFVVLQGDHGAAAVQAAQRRRPGVPVLALDLPGVDALEAALRAGAQLACCSLVGQAEPADARPLTPQARQLLVLMNQLARDADTTAVVATIKSDVSLSYRLLRQLNSASVGPAGALGSIEQAVALLGRNELYRWVSVLLVRQAPARPASPALQAMALARARLFELMAEACGEPRPGALFTMGLASMLPQLLQTRLPEALSSLQLHPLAEAALMERQGPWCAYLTLAEVLDESDLAEATALCQPFGGLQAVMAMSTHAWIFATRAPADGAAA